MNSDATLRNSLRLDLVSLVLRVGLGLVFLIGGWSKLGQLLDPAGEAAILASYLGPRGYINAFFYEYLFGGALGNVLTPWGFLTTLSTFELLSGIALIAGIAVRPLSLIYALLLWTFVVSLPVATVPGVTLDVQTYTSPALLVQARDIALSGMMFVLFNLGAGACSLDRRFPAVALSGTAGTASWDHLGLLLRLSIALPLGVAGWFGGLDAIATFGTATWITLLVALLLVTGTGVRLAGAVTVAFLIWYIGDRLTLDASLIANLNGFKRELALVAGGVILAYAGGGIKFSFGELSFGTESRFTWPRAAGGVSST